MKTLLTIQSKKRVQRKFLTDSERWKAVIGRDATADGKFYYSVRTTKVYCRPSCAARLANWDNVEFHDSWEVAECAGFRACKRCRPKDRALEEEYGAIVLAACRSVETAEESPSLALMAKRAGLSRFHFHRVFKKITGLTPKAYAMAGRAKRMRAELPKRATVTEAIYGAGFNSSGRFYAGSARMLGMAPNKFRQGGAGEVIRFAIGKCSLGLALVAASSKGICAILLGDDRDELARELQSRFRKAKLLPGEKGFARLVAQVIRLVEAPGLGWNLPLDVRGTVFQQRVWNALLAIPSGETASYRQIADRIGSPKAVRAVAGACAANSIAIVIPCHRVLRSDGQLSGYRWGVERKRALLDKEKTSA